jgi:hypothetical protein
MTENCSQKKNRNQTFDTNLCYWFLTFLLVNKNLIVVVVSEVHKKEESLCNKFITQTCIKKNLLNFVHTLRFIQNEIRITLLQKTRVYVNETVRQDVGKIMFSIQELLMEEWSGME